MCVSMKGSSWFPDHHIKFRTCLVVLCKHDTHAFRSGMFKKLMYECKHRMVSCMQLRVQLQAQTGYRLPKHTISLATPLTKLKLALAVLSLIYACYDALRRSKRHVQVGCTAKVSGVSRLVGVQRAVQNNGNMKSEPKIPGCEESPIRAFFLLNYLLLSWLLWWTDLLVLFFVRVASHRLRSALASALDSAKYVAKAQPCCPPRVPSPKNVVPMLSCNAHGIRYPAWAWPSTSNWHP